MSRLIPYTREVHLSVFSTYGETIWPLQLAFWLLAACVVLMAAANRRGTGRLAAILLAAGWIWTGIAWHGLYYAGINWAGYAYAAVFVLQGLLLLWSGGIGDRLALRGDGGFAARAGIGLAAVALLLVPAVLLFTGQGLRAGLAAPLAPTSLAIFTMGMLLMAVPRPPWYLLAWPAIWSVIGGISAWSLGLEADLVLPAAGLVAIVGGFTGNRPPPA